jgi:hypothetical protein
MAIRIASIFVCYNLVFLAITAPETDRYLPTFRKTILLRIIGCSNLPPYKTLYLTSISTRQLTRELYPTQSHEFNFASSRQFNLTYIAERNANLQLLNWPRISYKISRNTTKLLSSNINNSSSNDRSSTLAKTVDFPTFSLLFIP